MLGLVPFFKDIFIDPEDSVAVQDDKRKFVPPGPDTLNIGANIEAVKQLAISDKAKSQILGDNAVKILCF